MTGRAPALAGYAMVIDRLEVLGEPATADVVRQLRSGYIAEVDYLERAVTLAAPTVSAALSVAPVTGGH